MTNCIETIILFLQLILIGGQLYLSYKINKQSLSKNKGYFVLAEKRQYYDLGEKISFIVVGENDVIVTGSTIEVDNIIKEPNSVPKDTFFTRSCELNILDIDIPLSESEMNRDTIIIKVILFLKNPQGYCYKEEITLEFRKRKERPFYWDIIRSNLSFNK